MPAHLPSTLYGRRFGVPQVLTLGLGVVFLAACGQEYRELPPVVLADYQAEHDEWKENRRNSLVRPPGGSVLWMGLHELPQGASAFGSDPDLPIVLPEVDAPAMAGTLHRSGQEIRLEPAPGTELFVVADDEREPVTGEIVLGNDRSDDPTRLALGSLGLRIHSEPGSDRLWLRVWDEDMPERETFELPEYYPVDPAWRVSARFEPYPEPRDLEVPDITGGTVVYETPGELAFEIGGEEHRLVAVATPTASTYFLMVWDSTATTNTYQAGRYLRAPIADEEGWTTIDFNRTYNAPCVFTAFSVCAFPVRQNWLPLHVTAGEQRPAKPAY